MNRILVDLLLVKDVLRLGWPGNLLARALPPRRWQRRVPRKPGGYLIHGLRLCHRGQEHRVTAEHDREAAHLSGFLDDQQLAAPARSGGVKERKRRKDALLRGRELCPQRVQALQEDVTP